MTLDQFKTKFEEVKVQAINIFFNNAPVNSRKLRSMIVLSDTPDGFEITSNADYTEYTEESWANGKSNPNEGWFNKSFEQAFNYIVREMSS
jgi:hypothetical protein